MQYNALQSLQAFEAGQGQRKERERETAMKGIGNALASGDYAGGTAQAFQLDPMMGMQLQQYADGRNALTLRKDIGGKLGAGDTKGAMTDAFAAGELDMGAQIQTMMQGMEQADRERFAYSVQETATVAGSLLSYATPEERKQALMNDPQLQKRLEMAGIPLEQALNSPMDNASLEGQMQMGLTAGQIMEMRRADAAAETDQERFDLGYGLDLRRVQIAEGEAAAAAEARRLEAEAATANPNRKTEKDQNGVLRYLDNGEPVFPNVTTKPEVPKPLIGAESMGRVAAGLPVAKSAVQDLKRLLFSSKGTAVSMEGYSPGRDFGAGIVQDLGHIPLVGGIVRPATDAVSRAIGGEDYQLFEDSYGSYEAAMLPIMSGAAVTDTEALRQMRAVRIRPGDSDDTKRRKIAAMETQLRGLEMAARGDVQGFLGLLDQAQEIVKPDSAAQPTGLESASDDDLFLIMRGN
jgi:hypothetical protein